ncbi:MAG: hypothetical protein M3290_05210, partial [Actinomycetota bacterium]|nr:hypothetical protein [Actinomycetota bacterium]
MIARFEARTSVQWSPSGKWLLGTDGHLWSSTGEDRGLLFPEGSGGATWSPSADCAFAFSSDENKLFVGRPGHDPVAFVDGDLQSFEVSPDGRRLAAATFAGSEAPRVLVATIDLRNRSASSAELDPHECCVTFGGWSADGREPLLWAGAGVSVMADGAPLQVLVPKHGAASLHELARTVIPDPDYVTRCGGSVVAVVGG